MRRDTLAHRMQSMQRRRSEMHNAYTAQRYQARPTYPVPVVWVVADEHQVVKYGGHEFVRLPQGWALVAR